MPCLRLRLLMVLLLLAMPPWLCAAPSESIAAADDMAARVQACVACHGREGRATNQGYFPRIAGKPAGYLYNQLRNFRDGRRSYPAMNGLLEYLSDGYLMEMATYFSRMDVPYPAPQTHNAAPATLERGRVLVQQGDAARGVPACTACHGTTLTGVQKAIPGLVGLPRDYLNAQLGAWQAGHRHAHAPDCMADIARRLTPTDVSAVSTWLSSQPVAGSGKPAAQPPGPLPAACGGLEGGVR